MNKVSIKNRKASYDYFFEKEYVAGIQLFGTEVKQIRLGKVTLADCYCYFDKGELFVKGMNISAIEKDSSHLPLRPKKLLMKKAELKKLERSVEPGYTIIVNHLFSNDRNLIKANVVLAKGKKNYDKRESIKEKQLKREIKETL